MSNLADVTSSAYCARHGGFMRFSTLSSNFSLLGEDTLGVPHHNNMALDAVPKIIRDGALQPKGIRTIYGNITLTYKEWLA